MPSRVTPTVPSLDQPSPADHQMCELRKCFLLSAAATGGVFIESSRIDTTLCLNTSRDKIHYFQRQSVSSLVSFKQ